MPNSAFISAGTSNSCRRRSTTSEAANEHLALLLGPLLVVLLELRELAGSPLADRLLGDVVVLAVLVVAVLQEAQLPAQLHVERLVRLDPLGDADALRVGGPLQAGDVVDDGVLAAGLARLLVDPERLLELADLGGGLD